MEAPQNAFWCELGAFCVGDREETVVEKRKFQVDSQNANRGTKRGRELLRRSLEEFGAGRSILVDKHGRVIAGNKTYEQAESLGLSIRVVETNGEELVAVQRTDLDLERDAKARQLALADNRVSELNLHWDPQAIRKVIEEGIDLKDLWDPREIERLVAKSFVNVGGDTEFGGSGEGPFAIYSADQIIEAAVEYWREAGFPYPNVPRFVAMQDINRLAQMSEEGLGSTIVGYAVADTFHPHRFHCKAMGRRYSQYEAFCNDDVLRRSLKLQLTGHDLRPGQANSLSVVSDTQSPFNFRPGYALLIYRRYLPPEGGVVLDTCAGYGGRLVGFAALGPRGVRYIGVDPCTETYHGNEKLAEFLGITEKVLLIHSPIEDVPVSDLSGIADVCFTSPPYFDREKYSDEPTQSYIRYPTLEAWKEGFLLPMLERQYNALKPGCYNVINIASIRGSKGVIDLPALVLEVAAVVGFEYVTQLEYSLSKRPNAGEHSDREPVLVFRKK